MGAKLNLPDRICEQCGKSYNRKLRPSGVLESSQEYVIRKYCSQVCYHILNRGKQHHRYKTGFKHGHKGGYIRYTDGQYVHRVVMSEHIGRPLLTEEHVHHIDGDPTNNKIENLEIVSNSEHRKGHAAKQLRDKGGKFA